MLGVGWMNCHMRISDGQCWDFWNFPRTRLSRRWTLVYLANARSGLVQVFHLPEWKLHGSFKSYRRLRLLRLVHWTRQFPLPLLFSYPQLVCWQLKSPAYMLKGRNTRGMPWSFGRRVACRHVVSIFVCSQ